MAFSLTFLRLSTSPPLHLAADMGLCNPPNLCPAAFSGLVNVAAQREHKVLQVNHLGRLVRGISSNESSCNPVSSTRTKIMQARNLLFGKLRRKGVDTPLLWLEAARSGLLVGYNHLRCESWKVTIGPARLQRPTQKILMV